MNTKKLILSILIALFTGIIAFAQKPLVGSWMASDVISWSPETDKNLRYNKSTVKLQPRFEDKTLLANSWQQYDGKICNATIMWNRCGSQPSQGAFDFASYSFTHWQYVDMLVYWAGSAAEGIICPPAATWTDAAHANGVKMLGQIFLNGNWGCAPFSEEVCKAMFKRENSDGRSEFAKQLYLIAKNYGFDGWFINEEFGGGTDAKYSTFFDDYYYYAEKDGNKHYMQWYDAGRSPNRAIVDAHPNTSQFLEYGANYGTGKAEEFEKYYSGLQTVATGLGGGETTYKALFSKDGHKGSIDLFCPEENIWKEVLKANGVDTENYDDPSRCGESAYAAQEKVFANESRYFVNRFNDPTNQEGYNDGQWPGFATTCAERSAIMSKPFFTAFGNGLGKHRFVDGQNMGTKDWFHIGIQDILPTWRWWISNNADKSLTVKTDWNDAYQFGSSYKISGRLSAGTDHVMRLYKTQLSIENGDKFQFVYKTNTANSLKIQFGTKDGNHILADLPTPTTTTSNGWTVAEYNLSSLAGKTVSVIAINIKSSVAVADYSASLGQMLLYNGTDQAIGKVQNLTIQNKMGVEGGDIRVYWDAPTTGVKNVHHYDIYLTQNGVKTLAGQTKDCAFYIGNIKRLNESDLGPTLEVVPVSFTQSQGEATSTTETLFPGAGLPQVMVQTSKSLVTPGTQVTFTAIASPFPTGYKWSVPAGATDVTYSNNTMTCTLNTPGMTNVSVDVTNGKGTTEYTETALVEVGEGKELKNVSVGKSIDSASSTATTEGPQFLIDGETKPKTLTSKWCVNQSDPWVVIDLQNVYKVYRFDIYDCKVNEGGDNITDYEIEVSVDKINWTKVYTKTGNTDDIHVDWCKPTVAQYVRWNIHWPQPTDIRVWEFEVYGTNYGIELSDLSSNQVVKGKTTPLSVNFDMKDQLRSSDFNLQIVSASKYLKFANIKEDSQNSKFNFEVTGSVGGIYPIKLKLTNNGLTKSFDYNLEVADNSSANILLNQLPVEGYFKDYSKTTAITAEQAKLITDGDEATGVVTPYTYYLGDNAVVLQYNFDELYNVTKFEFIVAAGNSESAGLAAFKDIKIYSSEDGTNFNLIYSGAIARTITPATTVPAKAFKFSFFKDDFVDLTIKEVRAIGSKTPIFIDAPTFSVAAGEYEEAQSVELSCANEKATIYYTIDGTEPTAESTKYESAITVDESMTINAIAVVDDNSSEVVSAAYVINIAIDTPTFSVAGGEYEEAQLVELSCETKGASIYYTTDDTNPTAASSKYTSAISVDKNMTIKAVAIVDNTLSSIVSATYVIKGSGVSANIANGKGLRVYPNPIDKNGILNVMLPQGATAMTLVGLDGNVVASKTVSGETAKFELYNISSGMYMLVVTGENGRETTKVLVK